MERIVLDPSEFIEGRTELSLAELGLEVGEKGADYGESQVEVQLARQIIGESVTNRHLSNVTMTIPLRVQAESGVSLADAAYRLQQKVALWQAEGGWLRRDFSEDGEFAGSVGYRILTANLSGLQGWLMAHRQVAPEVTLKLIREPLCYSVAELEDTAASAEGELVETMEALVGTSPGLIRYRLKNENESAAWRGLIFAAECRDYPETGAETTAALSYEAKALTLKGGSSEAERESKKVVRNTALSKGWMTVLDSKTTASGHMTHRGTRRVFTRVYLEDEASDVQLRLLWRPLGTLSWSENEIVTPSVVDGWQIVDLGEARPEVAVVGEERWEFQIQARALSGSGNVDIHKVWPLPTEQFQILTAPGSTLIADQQSAKSPGTVEDNSGTGTIAWSKASEAKTSNNSYAECTFASGSERSHYLKATSFGFALPETATVLGIVASVERRASQEGAVRDFAIRLVKGGTIVEPGKSSGGFWPTVDTVTSYGSSSDLWEETWTAADVNSATFGVAISAESFAFLPESATAKVDAMTLTVYYTEAEDENRIAFATRSVELRSDGTYRQHPSEEVWGQIVPDEGSFCPTAPVSGLEGRKARFIAIPTQGDLGEVADSGTSKLSATIFRRPAYLFAREGA